MKFTQTGDGSITAFNTTAQEHYHSLSGAIEEAFEKHVNALGLENDMNILDFCFGLGYNSIAAVKDHKNLNIIGLENDINIIKAMPQIEPPVTIKQEYRHFASLAEQLQMTDINNNLIELLIGDARETIKTLPDNYFDRVYFDPFSPRKQPELWSEDVFRQVYRVMKKGAKLSTYSCARMVRDNMTSVGFSVIDGPVIGRKSPATIAIKPE